jgi:hypothetical protein
MSMLSNVGIIQGQGHPNSTVVLAQGHPRSLLYTLYWCDTHTLVWHWDMIQGQGRCYILCIHSSGLGHPNAMVVKVQGRPRSLLYTVYWSGTHTFHWHYDVVQCQGRYYIHSGSSKVIIIYTLLSNVKFKPRSFEIGVIQG